MSNEPSVSFEDVIIDKLNRIKYKLESQLVYITPNVNYMMNIIVNRARKNYVGQFDNPYFPTGDEKIWFPLTETLVKTARKLLKIKASDFDFVPLQGDTFGPVRIVHYSTLAALRRAGFESFLKRAKEVFTIDGTAIVKVSDHYSKEDKKRVLDLTLKDWFNCLFDHTANSLNDSPFLERFIISMDEARNMPNWKNVEGAETVDPRDLDPQATLASPTFKKTQEPVFVGWYCWIPVPVAWIKKWNKEKVEDGDSKKYVEAVIVASHLGETAKDEQGNPTSQWTSKLHYIAEAPNKKNHKAIKPYKLIRYERLPGRLPGRGPVEALFDLQLYVNIIVNLRYIGNKIRNMVLMFFNPQRTGLRPGDLERLGPTGMVPMNQLTEDAVRFPTIPTAVDTYNEQTAAVTAAQNLTAATDTAQAATAASKSATGSVMDSQYTQSSFQEIKETILVDFRELFDDLIVPWVIDNLDDEEILAVTGDMKDLEDFDDKIIKHHVATEALKFIERTGKIPTDEEEAAQIEKLRSHFRSMGKNRFIKNTDEFREYLKKLQYHIDLIPTDDTLPIETIVQELKEVMQMIPPENLQSLNLDANKIFAIIFDRLGYRYEALQNAKPKPQLQSQPQPQQQTPLTQGNSVAPQTNAFNKAGVNPVARAIK